MLVVALTACNKTEELQPVTPSTGTGMVDNKPISQFDTNGQKLLSEGSFMSNAHTTSGNVKLYDKAGKRTLVFTNFKTDAGPDLRLYLSEDKVASKFVEVSSKVNVGDYFVELPSEANSNDKKFVLIWCKQFAVLFGNAELK